MILLQSPSLLIVDVYQVGGPILSAPRHAGRPQPPLLPHEGFRWVVVFLRLLKELSPAIASHAAVTV